MLKTYVASHIQTEQPAVSYFAPVQTGSAQKEAWPGFLRDDVGDHISHLNRNFGELTGLYWVWKNTTEDKVGWCHYRRCSFHHRPKWGPGCDIRPLFYDHQHSQR